MKRFVFIILFLGVSFSLFAQQLPLYSQYMFNKLLINPAITGSEEGIPIRLTARQQWVGVDNAPSTQIVSGHYQLRNETMGIGGIIFADRFGPESRIGIQANYAYILPIFNKSTRLAFGLSFQVFQYQIDYNQLITLEENDPAINFNKENSWLPESDFGLYLYGENYYVGISANQMIELQMKIGGEYAEMNTLKRHYHVLMGYQAQISQLFALEPSVLIKATESTPVQLDLNLKAIYKKDYWAGVSYRTSGDIVCLIGLTFEEFEFGFATDFATSSLSHYQSGSFELLLGYKIGQTQHVGRSFF
ncbi:MAG: type IX secretion system membrane protein PorP/SprF [Bacteroidales bacterium]|jgi:type IX secretion system PorP/SprF family membrane protein|nr:type IX secretion system membrane protein PorP/SprF [Bacteroidales bacterium]